MTKRWFGADISGRNGGSQMQPGQGHTFIENTIQDIITPKKATTEEELGASFETKKKADFAYLTAREKRKNNTMILLLALLGGSIVYSYHEEILISIKSLFEILNQK